MKPRLAFTILLAGLASVGASDLLWTHSTALMPAPKRVEAGIGYPVSFAVRPNVELSSYVLHDALIPNVDCKLQWMHDTRMVVASTHGLAYPTPLLRLLAREGIGGIIAPDNEIPPLLSLHSHVLLTVPFERAAVTASLGARGALSFGDNSLETIDLPFVYPRTASYISGGSFDARVGLRALVTKTLSLEGDWQVFFMPGLDGNWAFEQGAMVLWQPVRSFAAGLGYRMSAAEYAFGVDRHIAPVCDLRYAWERKRSHEE